MCGNRNQAAVHLTGERISWSCFQTISWCTVTDSPDTYLPGRVGNSVGPRQYTARFKEDGRRVRWGDQLCRLCEKPFQRRGKTIEKVCPLSREKGILKNHYSFSYTWSSDPCLFLRRVFLQSS
jgi:hypothetical protein